MNRNEMAEKVSALLQDESFKGKLENAEDLDEVAASFRAEGIQVTAEELATAMDQTADGELNEDELENVSGGGVPLAILIAFKLGYLCGKLLLKYKDSLRKQGYNV